MTANPVAPVGAITGVNATDTVSLYAAPPVAPHARVSFAELFMDGVDQVSQKAGAADAMAQQFILNDSIPPHRVIYALEQSQLSLQIMLQVRNRLVEGYQDIMRMQL